LVETLTGLKYPERRLTPMTMTDSTIAMENRIKLTLRWARQSAEFMKVNVSDYMLKRVTDSVSLLTDEEVAQFLAH
jgi:hypothetical protein